MLLMQAALVAAVAAVPTVEIAPGVHMPMLSLGARQPARRTLSLCPRLASASAHPHRRGLSGTWQYNSSLAESVVNLGLKLGFTHIDTANNYKNQDGVGRALASHRRRRSRRRRSRRRSRSRSPTPCPCPWPFPNPNLNLALTPCRRATSAIPTF